MRMHESEYFKTRIPRAVRQGEPSTCPQPESEADSADHPWRVVGACALGMILLGVAVWFLSHLDRRPQNDSEAVNAPQRQKPANSDLTEPPESPSPSASATNDLPAAPAEQFIEVDAEFTPPMQARSPVPGAWSSLNTEVDAEDVAMPDWNPAPQKGVWSKIFRERKKAVGSDGPMHPAQRYAVTPDYFKGQYTNVQIDYPAPQLVGKDPSGRELRLSGFHGQVVLLIFWSGSCEVGTSMIRHGFRMLNFMPENHFFVLGVNRDVPGEFPLHNSRRMRDCVDGPSGPICREWKIDRSTLFVIDQYGIIRGRSSDSDVNSRSTLSAAVSLLIDDPPSGGLEDPIKGANLLNSP